MAAMTIRFGAQLFLHDDRIAHGIQLADQHLGRGLDAVIPDYEAGRKGAGLIAFVSANFAHDRRNDPVEATRGMFTTSDFSVASRYLGSERNFVRVKAFATFVSAGTSAETPPRPCGPWHCAQAN